MRKKNKTNRFSNFRPKRRPGIGGRGNKKARNETNNYDEHEVGGADDDYEDDEDNIEPGVEDVEGNLNESYGNMSLHEPLNEPIPEEIIEG